MNSRVVSTLVQDAVSDNVSTLPDNNSNHPLEVVNTNGAHIQLIPERKVCCKVQILQGFIG